MVINWSVKMKKLVMLNYFQVVTWWNPAKGQLENLKEESASHHV